MKMRIDDFSEIADGEMEFSRVILTWGTSELKMGGMGNHHCKLNIACINATRVHKSKQLFSVTFSISARSIKISNGNFLSVP